MSNNENSTYQPQSEPIGKGRFMPMDKGLGRIARKVLTLLAKGGTYSVVDITTRLGISDPRGHISELRAKGYAIGDMWVTTHYGNRYKRYFLKGGGSDE